MRRARRSERSPERIRASDSEPNTAVANHLRQSTGFGRREPAGIMPPLATAIEQVSGPFMAASPAVSLAPAAASAYISVVHSPLAGVGNRPGAASLVLVEKGTCGPRSAGLGGARKGWFACRRCIVASVFRTGRIRRAATGSVAARGNCPPAHSGAAGICVGAGAVPRPPARQPHRHAAHDCGGSPLVPPTGLVVRRPLLEERERACDEEVVRLGKEPAIYGEGILRVCEIYLQSPLRCVSGVGGASLRKRIEGMMANRTQAA